jgi:hypothetical protein
MKKSELKKLIREAIEEAENRYPVSILGIIAKRFDEYLEEQGYGPEEIKSVAKYMAFLVDHPQV